MSWVFALSQSGKKSDKCAYYTSNAGLFRIIYPGTYGVGDKALVFFKAEDGAWESWARGEGGKVVELSPRATAYLAANAGGATPQPAATVEDCGSTQRWMKH
jgi:hypothetical protein